VWEERILEDCFEKIGNVKMTYKFHAKKDAYSDGDVEDELLTAVKSGLDINEIIKKDTRWPVIYHFSPLRQNLLEWFDFPDNVDILEIGAGCGALTGLLCKKARCVKAVDLSKKRCLINAFRNREYANLEVIVSHFQDLDFSQCFDYITIIGVLEYANLYVGGNNPYKNFLDKAANMLHPNGKLIIAIENKLGLKYFSGAAEDHTGLAFDGIEDYIYAEKAETFSKAELSNLLDESGFKEKEFYYPYPDYKLPLQIFSDRYLPKPNDIFQKPYNYDYPKFETFRENYALASVIKASLFTEFANSFLVVANRSL
jgi:cyclopropane fatty-acyl-phospholipid synthase-like methyltransferase